jgi:hypothetical protein
MPDNFPVVACVQVFIEARGYQQWIFFHVSQVRITTLRSHCPLLPETLCDLAGTQTYLRLEGILHLWVCQCESLISEHGGGRVLSFKCNLEQPLVDRVLELGGTRIRGHYDAILWSECYRGLFLIVVQRIHALIKFLFIYISLGKQGYWILMMIGSLVQGLTPWTAATSWEEFLLWSWNRFDYSLWIFPHVCFSLLPHFITTETWLWGLKAIIDFHHWGNELFTFVVLACNSYTWGLLRRHRAEIVSWQLCVVLSMVKPWYLFYLGWEVYHVLGDSFIIISCIIK